MGTTAAELHGAAKALQRTKHGGDGGARNGRGVPDVSSRSHLQCACAPGYGGTLCGKVRTRSGCLCDEAALWPEGLDKARAVSLSSPCVPFASKTRCYVDARSCETAPASAPGAPMPFGAIRGADDAWDYC